MRAVNALSHREGPEISANPCQCMSSEIGASTSRYEEGLVRGEGSHFLQDTSRLQSGRLAPGRQLLAAYSFEGGHHEPVHRHVSVMAMTNRVIIAAVLTSPRMTMKVN